MDLIGIFKKVKNKMILFNKRKFRIVELDVKLIIFFILIYLLELFISMKNKFL